MSSPQARLMVVRCSAIRKREIQRGQWRFASSRGVGMTVLPGDPVGLDQADTGAGGLVSGSKGFAKSQVKSSLFATNASIGKPSACFLPRARRRDRFGFRSRTQCVESIQNRERCLGFTEGQGIAAHQVKLAGLIDQPIDLVGQGGKIVAADGDALLEEVVG